MRSSPVSLQRPLRENEYLVPVSYEMPRDRATLETEFSKNGVSELFYGDFKWRHTYRSRYNKVDQTPGDRVMLVKQTRPSDTVSKMLDQGYRPAIHLELYAFAKANPRLRHSFSIGAQGSYVDIGCIHNINYAILSCKNDRRILGSYAFLGWSSEIYSLYVRL